VSARRTFFVYCALAPTSTVLCSLLWGPLVWLLAPVAITMAIGLHDNFQTRHTVLRAYPILGHGRFLAERIRPEIQQYFVETNTNGTPFSRETREIVYQRAKGQRDKIPFGTQLDVYEPGHEFLAHSMYPKPAPTGVDRIVIGGPDCTQPFDTSLLNISAMSFGALSSAAVTALSEGAAAGGFALNTGEGGVSPYHLAGGADLIWQIGTGYFGCRTKSGSFDASRFADQASHPNVKAIEIKLSQGAKPGHGGILPGAKVTDEVAAIRGVAIGQTVTSPPVHSTFNDPAGLLEFVNLLRNLAGGKPVGIKLCVGKPAEVEALVTAMAVTGVRPDFIVVDGSEGGTGAAPPELSDSVGMPLREGLNFVHDVLVATEQRQHIRLIAAGKVATGFDMVRAVSLGADLCYSARAMMMALGCIQARRCHTNECPVGVATQDPQRSIALVVADKAQRVQHFHEGTMTNFLELVGAAGCEHPAELDRSAVNRRIDQTKIASYLDIYPPTPVAFSRTPSQTTAATDAHAEAGRPLQESRP